MSDGSAIRLFDLDPDLVRFLSEEDRAEAAELTVPIVRVGRGRTDLEQLLRETGAFGVAVAEGMILQSVQVVDHVGLRLLGPGDVAGIAHDYASTVRVACHTRTDAHASLALLNREILIAVYRWPLLLTGFLFRVAQQAERTTDQLVICQLPRVEDRVLALMWQLAESWGYVTRSGTVVPLTLTHELLGGLIGARRSTVTLAIDRLAERGAMVRTGENWLLLERPDVPARLPEQIAAPTPVAPTPLSSPAARRPSVEDNWTALRATIARLHEEHEQARIDVGESLRRLRRSRIVSAQIRERVSRDATRRRRAPSTRSRR